MSRQDPYIHFLEEARLKGIVSPKIASVLADFYKSYKNAIESRGLSIESFRPILLEFLRHTIDQIKTPPTFSLFHAAIRKPVDYYAFGIELFRPLIDFSRSKIVRIEQLDKMERQLASGENVILFANHQTEPDPQAISLLLEGSHPSFAERMVFVAGHRVVSDPLAVPLSLGRNLLCIFSKKHIEHPPEEKEKKLLHNQRTLKKMEELLAEGGRCIYVAPSGGRDRIGKKGKPEVAAFDPQSTEMFWLVAKRAGPAAHFYPLSLATYDLFPPPRSVEKELGEARRAKCAPLKIAFGEEINMEEFPGSKTADKKLKRKLRADYIHSLVLAGYKELFHDF